MGLACCYDLSGMHMVRASCASTAMLRRLQLSDSTDLPAMLTVHSWQELVRAATVNCARLFMQDHELGRVEVRVFFIGYCAKAHACATRTAAVAKPVCPLRHLLSFPALPPAPPALPQELFF